MRPLNCINCGAPLQGDICEYCGTNYTESKAGISLPNNLSVEVDDNLCTVKLNQNEYVCYINDIIVEKMQICSGTSYGRDGRLHKNNLTQKHKFSLTLIEK